MGRLEIAVGARGCNVGAAIMKCFAQGTPEFPWDFVTFRGNHARQQLEQRRGGPIAPMRTVTYGA